MTDNQDAALTPDIKFQLVRKIECHKVIGLAGCELLEHEAKYLEFHRLSGVIVFERNLESLTQFAELIESVEDKLTIDGVAPLVMADHEGDFVSELRRLIGTPPSAMAIAATDDTSFAEEVAFETGQAMMKLGVNVVLAPVADLFHNAASPVTGLRTFGSDPERVAEFVSATIRGFRKAGVLTCIKHFPGHGATGDDSHVTLPEVHRSLDDLRGTELVPFARAIADGADMVMTAHVAFSMGVESDERAPASFDSRLIGGLLREELGFEGAVITDALEMEGAREHTRAKYAGLAGGSERVLLAGADLLLYSSPVPERIITTGDSEPMIAVEVMQTIIETLHKVVHPGRINRKLEEAARQHEGIRNLLNILNHSEARIARLRQRVTVNQAPPVPKEERNVIQLQDYASVPSIYKTVAERSLILLRDPEPFIPVQKDAEWVLLPIEYEQSASLKRQDLLAFTGGLRRNFPWWRSTRSAVGFEADASGMLQPVFAPPAPSSDFREPQVDITKASDRLPENTSVLPVLSVRGTPPEEFLVQLTEFTEQRQVPFVIVTGWPVVDWIPESVGVLLTFGASQQVAAAVAAVLAGQAQASGTLQGLV
jgi:beta-N-acetylhexosaminidase